MKEKKSNVVFILKEKNWIESEFKNIKEKDIFCFNTEKDEIFTASCDSFFNFDGTHADKWSVLLMTKQKEKKKTDLEILLEGK